MALFKRKKDNDDKLNVGNAAPPSEAPKTDIFDKVFSQEDARQRQMTEFVQSQQPKSISENHKDFVSDFDQVQIAQSVAYMNSRDENAVKTWRTTERVNSSSQPASNEYYGMSSVIGRRDYQQDAVAVSNPNVYGGFSDKKWLGILCDGMGGMNGGEKASAVCVEMMLDKFIQQNPENIPIFFRDSAIDIDYAVASLIDDYGNYLGAGSTLISVIIDGNKLYWCSVGDSHIYVIRDGQLRRLNVEHNYMMELMKQVQRGDITLQEAEENRDKDALISYMGIGDLSLIDINDTPLELLLGDYIVLCSDGLYRSVTTQEIIDTIASNPNDVQRAANLLTALAMSKNYKYQDNTTVLVIKYV